MKVFPNIALFLNTICNLQQLRMFFDGFLNLVLVCKDIELRYGRTRTREFFPTVRVVSFTTCMLSINFLKHLSIESLGEQNFKNFFLDKPIHGVI